MAELVRIGKGAPEFHDVRWVMSARSTDEHKQALTHVFRDGKWLVATDGHRVHALDMSESDSLAWPDGLYAVLADKGEIILERRDNGLRFPDWRCIFPNGAPEKRVHIGFGGGKDNYTEDFSFARLMRALPDGHAILHKYFAALAGARYYEAWIYAARQPVCFGNYVRLAAIQPATE